MLGFTDPGFLIAGALLAALPVALHMLARTPPERRPLPTTRFLAPDRRTRVRLRPPTDRLLLALRVLFLLLLAAAFAGPEWRPARDGTGVVVALDAGSDMAPFWDDAVAAARERLVGGGALVIFDTVAHVIHDPDEASLDSLAVSGPADAPGEYLAALRGLARVGETLPRETATATLVTRPRWSAWSPAIPAVRPAAWPAAIELVVIGETGGDGAGAPAPADTTGITAGITAGTTAGSRPTAAIVGPGGDPLQPFVTAALRALGYDVRADSDGADAPSSKGTDVAVVLPSATAASSPPAADRIVVIGAPTGEVTEAGGSPGSAGRLVVDDLLALDRWRPTGAAPGRQGTGDPTVATPIRALPVWEDGRPAATARRGNGCVAELAAEPSEPAAAADPAFPHLLARLISACAPPDATAESGMLAGLPLDAGALAVLRGSSTAFDGGLPRSADLASLGSLDGRPLRRLVLLLTLMVALVETALAYVRRESP